MSTPENVPVFDIEMFKSNTYSLGMQLEVADDEGAGTGVFYDLTDKVVSLEFSGMFSSAITLRSDTEANANGSVCQIVGDPTEGNITWSLSATDLSRARKAFGHWYTQIIVDENNSIPIIRGTIKLLDFATGGTA